ncbi:MAG TPA: SET domain-containing protein [Candidatus Paceibacterota bacterium]|nr:SET domain-containing protein [Candidatus Paceibacterota bacterium]
MGETNEFSFVLKPAAHGVGVFATHGIAKGTHLRMFGDGETVSNRSVVRNKEDVPEQFREYCADRGEKLLCPADFGQMAVGWYLNHSREANAIPDEDYKWYAARDIEAGEEITIDYNSLGEPAEAREDYYSK